MDAISVLNSLKARLQQERKKYIPGCDWSVPEYPEEVQEGLDCCIEFIDESLKGLEDCQAYTKP